MGKIEVAFILAVFAGVCQGAWIDTPVTPSPSDIFKCGKLALGLESCWLLGADLPKCSGKSHLQMCSNFFMKNVTDCNIELLQRFLKATAQGYANSDKILCQNSLYKAFLDNLDCWVWARKAAESVIFVTKGFVTSDGCQIVDLVLEAYKAGLGKECGPLVAKYVDPLYKASPCGTAALAEKEYMAEVINLNDNNFR